VDRFESAAAVENLQGRHQEQTTAGRVEPSLRAESADRLNMQLRCCRGLGVAMSKLIENGS
jgi:hypothetical protein